jgi:cellulose synthase/poly-beta-1,6-N-acetylglucosamine synthase-like glycosyltransferase
MILYVLLILLAGIAYFSLLSHYAKLWDDTPEVIIEEVKEHRVSILIPFRNEKESLPSLISSLEYLEQGEADLEILFVDDHSTDFGDLCISEYSGELNLRLVRLQDNSGKKAAIKFGWDQCQGDIVIQTDADCILPVNWLRAMLKPFDNKDILLASGPVLFHSQNNFWLRIVSLDFAGLIAIGAAHLQWNKPMICNAANLAYRKSLVKDAKLNEDRASGDDVFLLQSAFHKNEKGIVFVKSNEAIVETAGPLSFREFWNQRLRWASKNGEYDIVTNTWILVGVWLFNVLILASFLSFTAIGATAGAFLILLKILAEDKFYGRFVDFFGITSWFANILVGQPFHILYMVIVPPLSQVLKYQWKERKVSK